ncbi:hypothetical protein ACHAXA_001298 [Cyclostephanos tholiformis]|uniref:CST complex subunit CTC1 n=1 Tax=Cyclostephanos tholiformis TaxID=382380 RepID=A0ABD3RAK9_9STRA
MASTQSNNGRVVSDVDYRVIGLSPQYWSFTPLLVGDLIGLPLINGVDCFVSPANVGRTGETGHDTDCEGQSGGFQTEIPNRLCSPKSKKPKLNGNPIGSWNILPLSRVLLKGIATAIVRRPNGCTQIVLDDGTGAIDVLYWDNSHDGNSAYNLPPLLSEHETSNNRRGFRFDLGDSLEVMGKIKVMTAGKSNTDNCMLSDYSPIPLEVRFGCVREIHATSVCLMDEGQTRMANQWNGEIVHWLKCMKFSRKCSLTNDSRIRNGKNILPLLGDSICASIESASCDLCGYNDRNVQDRECCQTPRRFRSAFFYCHCEATWETLDPSFRFRDAFLHRLLDLEAQLQRTSDSCFPSATEDCIDLLGVPPDTILPPFLFTFESVFNDKALSSIASETVASTTLPEVNAQRLIRKVFAAITKEGILSLFDPEEDLYVLVSRNRVIEPFLKRSMGADEIGLGVDPQFLTPPFFMSNVPKKRITAIKNWIEEGNAA